MGVCGCVGGGGGGPQCTDEEEYVAWAPSPVLFLGGDLLISANFYVLKILYTLVGGPQKHQKFHWSYAGIPESPVIFCRTQLASA